MQSTCSNDMPPLPKKAGCGWAPSHSFTGTYYPTESELAAIEQLQDDSLAAELAQVDALVAARPEPKQPMLLMVGDAGLAAAVARRLVELGADDIEVKVASAPEPVRYNQHSQVGNYPPVSIEYYWGDKVEPRPRHRSTFTKSHPTTKVRKAARRRARTGRKASR